MNIYNNVVLSSSENETFLRKKIAEKTKHISCSGTFSRKSCSFSDYEEKCGRAGQARDDKITRRRIGEICMLDN